MIGFITEVTDRFLTAIIYIIIEEEMSPKEISILVHHCLFNSNIKV